MQSAKHETEINLRRSHYNCQVPSEEISIKQILSMASASLGNEIKYLVNCIDFRSQ